MRCSLCRILHMAKFASEQSEARDTLQAYLLGGTDGAVGEAITGDTSEDRDKWKGLTAT